MPASARRSATTISVPFWVSLVTSLLTLFSMAKIWSYGFWRASPRAAATARYRGMMTPTAVLVAFTVVMGLVAQPFLRLANDAARDVVDPSAYQAAVLVPVPPPALAGAPGGEGSGR